MNQRPPPSLALSLLPAMAFCLVLAYHISNLQDRVKKLELRHPVVTIYTNTFVTNVTCEKWHLIPKGEPQPEREWYTEPKLEIRYMINWDEIVSRLSNGIGAVVATNGNPSSSSP